MEHINFWCVFIFVLPAETWMTNKITECPLGARKEIGLKGDKEEVRPILFKLSHHNHKEKY